MRPENHMLETYTTVLTQSFRNLKKNIIISPFLYVLFSLMILFSSLFIGFLTVILLRTNVSLDINNIFFIVFFLFMLKSSHDFYFSFTKSEPVTYTFSTPQAHWKTVFELFLVVFWVQLGLWVLFSTLYMIPLVTTGVPLIYPLIYLKFTAGIILATIIGSTLVIHYFSSKKYRLIPLGFLLYALFVFSDSIALLVIILFSFVFLLWSLQFCLDSYQFISRKQRIPEKSQVWLSTIKQAVFHKEIIVLWRERILFSILFSSVLIGVFSGYLARFGADEFLPAGLEEIAAMISPEAYGFFGIYVLTVHGAVFVSLSFFLNEADTLWLLRHLPVRMQDIVKGKARALLIPFLCCIPFIAYYAAFTTLSSIPFLLWFLGFSFLASIIVCFPLGARYAGRKSDILLLYSISLFIFMILGFAFSLNYTLGILGASKIVFYLFSILIELFLFYFISIRLTAFLLTVRYDTKQYS